MSGTPSDKSDPEGTVRARIAEWLDIEAPGTPQNVLLVCALAVCVVGLITVESDTSRLAIIALFFVFAFYVFPAGRSQDGAEDPNGGHRRGRGETLRSRGGRGYISYRYNPETGHIEEEWDPQLHQARILFRGPSEMEEDDELDPDDEPAETED